MGIQANGALARLLQGAGIQGWGGHAGGPHVVFLRVPSWLGQRDRHPENCEAPLELGYGAALAGIAGWRWTLLDLETGAFGVEETLDALERDRPDLLVLGGITPAVPSMVRLAQGVRQRSPGTLILAHGQHADALPESLIGPGSTIDACLRGELEFHLPQVLGRDRAEIAGMPGVVVRGDGPPREPGDPPQVSDLDALPWPRHEAFLNRRYRYLHPMRLVGRHRWGFLQGSRGCPFPCIYCSRALRTSYGPHMRYRSPEGIVEEMRWLERHGVNVMVFTDDVFNLDRDRVLRLCDAILRAGLRIRWTAEGRVRPADLEMFRMMRRAGCTTFSMGVESGSPRILESLRKQVTLEEIEAAFRLAREAGLWRVAFFMVACPGETAEDFEATRRLMRRLDPEMIQVAFFTGYPGSEAWRRHFADQGLPWEAFQHYERLTNLSAEPDAVVRTWQRRLYRDFALRPSFLVRYLWQKNLNLLWNPDTEGFLVSQGIRVIFRR
ncbi:MAG TPA: radical SAM protein [Myxococcota bacterium]|nr:radical SAM protein [Myxococcota bacterium]HQK52589.1 radical SAM protein [Myxococcota bacterium]